MESSSRNLHPSHGARFVMTRLTDRDSLQYAVTVYRPNDRWEAILSWPEGQPHIEPSLPDPWASAEVYKLARILRRTPRASLTRWRGP